MKHHKSLSFLITCFLFSPLLLFAMFDKEKVMQIKGQENISFILAQFKAQGSVQNVPSPTPPAPLPPEPKPIEQPKKEKKEKPKKKLQHKKHARKVPKPKEVIEEEQPKASAPPAGAQINNNAPTQIGTLAFGKSDDPFLRAVKRAIDEVARDSYPRQAQRMRLQGKVLLEFVWLDGKRLGEVKIIKGSGHRILDDNVLKVIQKAAQQFPNYDKTVRIQIPIDYNIKDKR